MSRKITENYVLGGRHEEKIENPGSGRRLARGRGPATVRASGAPPPECRPPGGPGAAARDKQGNVYAGKDGNVYKRDNSGNWSKNSGSGWQATSRPQPTRELNAQAGARARGNMQARRAR